MIDHGDCYEVDLGPCPSCGAPVNAHAPADGNPPGPPEAGSAMICGYCAAPAMVTELGTMRPPTPRELTELSLDVRFQVTRGLILQNPMQRPASS